MKHLSTIILIGIITALMAACGGKKSPIPAAEDSVATVEQESPVAGDTVFYLTSDSLGPVHIGEKIADLPEAYPNLYDVMLVTETPDAVAYMFLLGDIPQFTIYDFNNSTVDLIALESNSRGVMTPKGVIRIGDPFTKVLSLPGISAEWQTLDDSGIWYWRYEGLFIGVEETNISEKLAQALCENRTPPRAELFDADVKIGYIGTGLPF